MSELKKCDRCGKIISNTKQTTDEWGMIDARRNDENIRSRYDLCKKCFSDFMDFLAEMMV